MNRRDLLKIAIASSVVLLSKSPYIYAQNKRKIKPRALKVGDKIGIIAPATFTPSAEEIDKAKQFVEGIGLVPVWGKTFSDKTGWKTKPVELRAEEIMEMFANPEIKGIFCIRGGYGSIGIIDKLDYNLISKNPKIFAGFSDITALHLAIRKKSNLTTLHTQMLTANFSSNIEYLKHLLFQTTPVGEFKNKSQDEIRKKPFFTIRSGTATGELIGGNLSLIASLIGTNYEIDTDGKILFLEDVGEEPYRIDRMLHQLRLAGKLENLKGLVFGLCTDCDSKSSNVWDKSLLDVLIEHFGNRQYPSFYGLAIGHTPNQFPLPIGVESKIDADDGSIAILESFCE